MRATLKSGTEQNRVLRSAVLKFDRESILKIGNDKHVFTFNSKNTKCFTCYYLSLGLPLQNVNKTIQHGSKIFRTTNKGTFKNQDGENMRADLEDEILE